MMTGGAETVLTVEDLAVGRPEAGAPPLVEDVRFTLESGEILGIAGESGSGKTLTACALAGLLPPPLRMTAGRVCFRGRPVDPGKARNPGFRRGQDLLFLFQSPSSALDPTATVGRQIADALRATGACGRKAAGRQTRELMEMVGLPRSLFSCYPFQLSGGQRQRAILAIAFGLRPRVLIADEPTAGQDEENRDQILLLLEQLRQTGVAAVIISHDLRVLSKTAAKLVVMYRGKQVEAGLVSEILEHPDHFHTRELLEAMRYLEGRP